MAAPTSGERSAAWQHRYSGPGTRASTVGASVVRYRAEGKHRAESARTLEEAKRIRARRVTEVSEDSFRESSRQTFAEYAREWIATYQGKGRGFRERTRDDYRRDLERYVIPFLGSKRMTTIRPSDVRKLIAWLVDDGAQMKRHEQENVERRTTDGGTADSAHVDAQDPPTVGCESVGP